MFRHTAYDVANDDVFTFNTENQQHRHCESDAVGEAIHLYHAHIHKMLRIFTGLLRPLRGLAGDENNELTPKINNIVIARNEVTKQST